MTDEVHEISVSRDIGAAPETVWAMVSDVTRMGEWSPENVGGEWLGGATAAQPGVKFRGANENGKKRWKTVATVLDATPGKRFSFRVSAGGMKVAEWRYDFEPTASGCLVTETWIDERFFIMNTLGKLATGVGDRAAHNRAGMEQTLDALKAKAEASATAP